MKTHSIFSTFALFGTVLLLTLIRPSWGLFAIIGFSIGFTIRRLIVYQRFDELRRYMRFVVLFIVACVGGMLSAIFILPVSLLLSEFANPFFLSPIIGFTIAFIILLIIYLTRSQTLRKDKKGVSIVIIGFILGELFIAFWLPFFMRSTTKAGRPWFHQINYSGHFKYVPESNQWEVHDEIQIDEKHLKETLQRWISKDLTKELPALADVMISLGWEESGRINGKLRFTKQRKHPVSMSVFRLYTVDTLFIPVIKYDQYLLTPNDESQVILDVPKLTVANTYPLYSSRVDILRHNREQLTIPIARTSQGGYIIRTRLLHPLLSNKVGQIIIRTLFWSPFKWVILAICAIFAEQIRKGILIPFVKRVFHLFRMRYLEDEKSSDEPKLSTKPDDS